MSGLTAPAPDDASPRAGVVRAARVSVAAALAVLVAGLLMIVRDAEPSAIGAQPTPTEASAPSGSRSQAPTVARVALSTGGTRSSPVVWRVGLGGSPSKNVVLVAYETYVGTTVRLDEQPEPDDVALPQVALDPQLGRLRRALAADAAAGMSRRGRVIAVARVETLHAEQAVVVGCVDGRGQRRYGPDGSLLPGWHGTVSVSRVRMRRQDGRWKVYLLTPLPTARCRH